MRQKLIWISLIFSLSACDQKQKAEGDRLFKMDSDRELQSLVPYGKKTFESLVQDLTLVPREMDIVSAPQFRNPDYQISEVLSRLHPWLQINRGLIRKEVGEFQFLAVRPIPARVLREIMAVARDDIHDTGLLILQRRFWQRLADSQLTSAVPDPNKDQLIYGFLEISPQPISGVYFHQHSFNGSNTYNAIAIDLYANSGTLDHEWRHHVQHEAIQDYNRSDALELNASCVQTAGVAFGEVDSTAEQLPLWVSSFENVGGWATSLEQSSQLRNIRVPVLPALFEANLNYPGQALNSLDQSKYCPESVKTMVRELIDFLADQRKEVTSPDSFESLTTSIPLNLQLWGYIRDKNCAAEDSPSLSPRCATIYQEIRKTIEEGKKAKLQVAGNIAHIALTRRTGIGNILNRYSKEDFFQDLCRFSTGFSFLADCR